MRLSVATAIDCCLCHIYRQKIVKYWVGVGSDRRYSWINLYLFFAVVIVMQLVINRFWIILIYSGHTPHFLPFIFSNDSTNCPSTTYLLIASDQLGDSMSDQERTCVRVCVRVPVHHRISKDTYIFTLARVDIWNEINYCLVSIILKYSATLPIDRNRNLRKKILPSRNHFK